MVVQAVSAAASLKLETVVQVHDIDPIHRHADPGQAVREAEGVFVNRVDTAWQPSWVGTEQRRYFTIDGETLRIRSAEQTLPQFGDRRLVSVVTFRRA